MMQIGEGKNASDAGARSYPFGVRRINDAAGAEISGLNLSQPIGPELRDALYDAILDHHVLVFRDQSLTKDQQARFAENYGELENHVGRLRNGERYPTINDITNVGDDGKPSRKAANRGPYFWHSDKSYHAIPSLFTMLHGIKVPTRGGETQFANTRRAHEALPEKTKARIDGLMVEHSWEANRIIVGEIPATEEQKRERPPVTHPLVVTHPDTGAKSLYLGTHISHIHGMPREESAALVDELMDHAAQPQFRYDHVWQEGDFVMWDNRSLMHRGNMKYAIESEPRVLQRTVIIGTRPV
ncbi:MAG: TauD/TfdA family dioxygenase [Pseudomonadota bacterium]